MLEERIRAYLETKLPQAEGLSVADLRRIAGGASRETWSFDACWREDDQDVRRGFVLRRDPDGMLEEATALADGAGAS